MRRLGIVLATLALGATGLTACSGDGAYCSKLEERGDSEALANLDVNSPEILEKAKKELEEITEVAPDDVKPEWERLTKALDTANEVAADPANADLSELNQVTTDLTDAMQTISNDAEERCGIQISS